MVLKQLIDTYFLCRANKRRSTDSVHFELHWERDIVRLKTDFDNRDLEPFSYAFVTLIPKPREINACLMQMKILQFFFDLYIRPLVEERLTDRTFNNRVGFGPDVAVNQLLQDIYELSEGFTKDCWIISEDIKAFFPSATLDNIYNQYKDLILESFPDSELRDDLLYILMRSVYAYPRIHSRRRSPLAKWEEYIEPEKSVFLAPDGKGATLGHQFWQVAMGYNLNDFDHKQVEQYPFRYVRFVDDMRWVTTNKELCLAHMPEVRKDLAEQGYKLHPRKFQCQHFTKGGSFLGNYFKMDRVYISNRIIRRMEQAIHYWNELVNPYNLEHFLSCLNSYFGRLKGRNEYGNIRDIVDLISEGWWKYCHYDDRRKCLVANEGYTHNELLCRMYHFKLYKNEHKRTNSKVGRKAA